MNAESRCRYRLRSARLVIVLGAALAVSLACVGTEASPALDAVPTATTVPPAASVEEATSRLLADVRAKNSAAIVSTFTAHGVSRAVAFPGQTQEINQVATINVEVTERADGTATACLVPGDTHGQRRTVAIYWIIENGQWKIDDIMVDQPACGALLRAGG